MPLAAGRNSSRSRPLESSERSKLTLKNSLLDTWKIDLNDYFEEIYLRQQHWLIESRVRNLGLRYNEFETRILENTRESLMENLIAYFGSKNRRNSSTLYNDCNRDVPWKFEFLMKRNFLFVEFFVENS